MKKGLCEPNRYEITVKTPGKAKKTHGKAEKWFDEPISYLNGT